MPTASTSTSISTNIAPLPGESVADTFKRLRSLKGVRAVLLLDARGACVHSAGALLADGASGSGSGGCSGSEEVRGHWHWMWGWGLGWVGCGWGWVGGWKGCLGCGWKATIDHGDKAIQQIN